MGSQYFIMSSNLICINAVEPIQLIFSSESPIGMLRLETLNRTINKKCYDYIIIGAGIGGLYSAQLLAENGVTNFLVLQAQEGVGGRVQTVRLGEINETNKYKWIKQNSFLSNFAIEKGATWIQESHLLLRHMANEMGITLRKQHRQGVSSLCAKDRSYTTKQLLSNPQFSSSMLGFIDKFMDLSQHYRKEVIEKRVIDEEYKRLVLKYDSMTLAQYLEIEVEDTFVRDIIHGFMEHIECLGLKEDSVHELLLRAAKSGDMATLTQWLRIQEDPSYIVNGGTEVFLDKIQDQIESLTGRKREHFIQFEQEVVAIDNSIPDNLKLKVNKNGKTFQYNARKVIINAPIGTLNKILITNLSLAKQMIFSNQTRNLVTKSFILTKRPFWKDKFTGDGLYTSDYNVSMSHDVSPINNECGAMVFFHCGDKYLKWHQQFPLMMPNRTQVIKKYYKSILAKMFLDGNQESPELSDLIYIQSSMIDNRFVLSAFQSNCKPGTLTALLKVGEVFQKYYDDEDGLIFVGSQFSEDYNSYMEGAVRSASKKISQLFKKEDLVKVLEKRHQFNRTKEKEKQESKDMKP